jgi:hypothetical protein
VFCCFFDSMDWGLAYTGEMVGGDTLLYQNAVSLGRVYFSELLGSYFA